MAADTGGTGQAAPAVANILLVDDDPAKLIALETVLAPLGQNLVRAVSGREALRCVLAEDFAVILLDVRMAGMDGFETAELIRQRERSERTPIIFVTSYGAGEANMERGYGLGAVDFIFAPLVPEILRAKVSVFVDLCLKTEEIRQQEERLRLLEQREHRRLLERAELGRLQAEARFASVLAVAEDAIMALDGDRHVVLFNRGAERTFGRSASETIGQPIDVLLPDGVEEIVARRSTAAEQRRAPDGESHHEVRGRRSDGRIFAAEMTLAEFPEDGRTITAVILRDISERKAAEAEVRRLNEDLNRRLSAGVDLVAHLAASLDPSEVLARLLVRASAAVRADEGMLLRVDEGGLSLAGRHTGAGTGAAQPAGHLDRQPLIRRAIAERLPVVGGGFDLGLVDGTQRDALQGVLHTAVLPLVVEDRVRALLVLSRHRDEPFSSGDTEMLMLIGNVATVALRNAQLFDEAQQASVTKSEFLRMAAHELRTPAGVLRGYLSMLRDGTLGPCPPGWERPLSVVDAKAAELTGLIDDLLLAAGMEGGSVPVHAEVFDLRDAVRAAVGRAEGRATLLGASVEQVLPEEPVLAEADPDHVGRILDNLVNNALTYSAGPPWVQLTVTAGQAPRVSVEDHGVGIPAELVDHVFERFYRVNDPALGYPPGTGLGLYISRDLARRAGGALVLEHSEPLEGSRFRLSLRAPASSHTAADLEPAAPTSGERRAGGGAA
jgi:PAS domain S-box-containing protein